MLRQGGPGVCAGEGVGSASEAPEALLATGEASSFEEEQGCSRAQLRTRAASLSRLAGGEGSAGVDRGRGLQGQQGKAARLWGCGLRRRLCPVPGGGPACQGRLGEVRRRKHCPGWLEERLERRLGQGGLSAACHGSCRPPARVEGLLLHAVFAWQAQLSGRGEEAALEAVQGELAGLFRKERLLVVGVPPLVPGQAGRPAQRFEAVVIAAGHKAGQRGLGDVGQREEEVRLRLRVQLERLCEAGQPGEHPAGAGEGGL